MKKISALILSFFFFCFFLNAQERPTLLFRADDGKYLPLSMNSLRITVQVFGNLATTNMEISFYNDLNRILEGQFYFPLSEGQTVSGFSLEVNGKMREGVIVEKAKGRQVFEETVRKQIDPGLLEWTKGNSFKARIYPIPAKGYKRLSVTYEQELPEEGNGFLYILPLAFTEKTNTFSLKVEVLKQNIQPELASSNELVNFQFRKWNEAYLAEMEEKNYLPDKQLAFILPKTKSGSVISLENSNNKTYFHLTLNPAISSSTKKLPKKICLVWDASQSAEKRQKEREFALLGNYLNKCGDCTVEMVVFRNAVEEKPESFPVKKGNWDALKSRLAGIPYDGGTTLGSLDFSRYTCDEILLFTDGVSTFGEKEIRLSNTPVMVINSVLAADHSYLNFIAQKTNGVYINLSKLNNDQALIQLLNQPFTFIRAEYDTSQVSEVFPSLPTIVTKEFSFSGKLLSKNAKITLHFGFPGKITHSETITINKNDAVPDTDIISAIWAQKKIYELSFRYDKNRDEIMKTGQEFSVVTKETSLIVLDRTEDYVQYRIVPPEELRKEYYAILKNQEKEEKQAGKSHLDEVALLFKELKEWWNKKFSFDKPPVKEQDKKMMMEDSGEDRLMEESSVGSAEDENLPSISDERESNEKPGEKESDQDVSGMIELKKWEPDTPYLKELKSTTEKDIYTVYLKLKEDYLASSAFYLDVADFFIEKKQEALALRILSNIAEMELDNHQLLRILGHRLDQLGYFKLAISVFDEVRLMREEEPQSYRDLGLVYAKDKQYQAAVDLLWQVVRRKWDARFPAIELIALTEMNSIIAQNKNINTLQIDKRFLENLPVDIRVVLDWDADNTDIDLWVIDPNGEKSYYGYQLSYVGGRMSRDFTRGYGPEEYMLKKAKPGTYTIQINYYGNTQQVIAGATTIQVKLILNFGRKNETVKEITLRLKENKEVITVGEFKIKVTDGKIEF